MYAYVSHCFRSISLPLIRSLYIADRFVILLSLNRCFVDFHIKSAVSLQRATLKKRKSTSSLYFKTH